MERRKKSPNANKEPWKQGVKGRSKAWHTRNRANESRGLGSATSVTPTPKAKKRK